MGSMSERGSMTIRRVLLSAYACSPLQGSEPGIGWRWSVELAGMGYDVTVLTRAVFREEIDAYGRSNTLPGNLHFAYLDWSEKARFGVSKPIRAYAYAYFWQFAALLEARRLHRRQPFDLVQHVTLGSIRLPTLLGALGLPMILGPLGGGEAAPPALRQSYPLRGKIIDFLRDLSNQAIRLGPLMHFAFARADLVVLRTAANGQFVPRKYRGKVMLGHDIGASEAMEWRSPSRTRTGVVRLLFAGRFLYWKGMHLGLEAFARLLLECPGVTLTMLGRGPERRAWRAQAGRLGIADKITWIDWIDQSKMGEVFCDHDIFFFPSLHDAGATVIYEAASHGLPTVCLGLGAPGELVDEECGVNIAVDGIGEAGVIAELAKELSALCRDPERIERLSASSRKWAARQTWESRVRPVYERMTALLASRQGPEPAPGSPPLPRNT
jgi:glycosyltransferase involved in cell wall biosynthesis